jgi:elongation factor Ts
MADISPELVRKLRETTGAGMMDCKRALEASSGDFDKAVKVLREKGAASAAKRAGRATAAGWVASWIDPAGKSAVLLELNCETDFVARTDDFKALVQDLVQKAGTAAPEWSGPADAPQDRLRDLAAKLGENVALRRFQRYGSNGGSVLHSSYIHPSGGLGSVGVLIELAADKAEALQSAEAKALAKDLAMQVAAASPRWVSREEIPADVLEQEKSIAREQARRDNKPEAIWDKIVQGKVQQFCRQFCLLEQPFVKDESQKLAVGQVVEQVSKKVGAALAPKRFVRYRVGEEE